MRWMIIMVALFGLLSCQQDSDPGTKMETDADTLRMKENRQPTGDRIPEDPLKTNAKGTIITPGYERLVGSWTTKSRRATIISIYPDGRLHIEVEGWPTVEGTFTMRGNRMSLMTNSDLMCTGQTGVYDIYYAPGWHTLFFEKIKDNCDTRQRRLRRPLTRVSDTPGVPPGS